MAAWIQKEVLEWQQRRWKENKGEVTREISICWYRLTSLRMQILINNFFNYFTPIVFHRKQRGYECTYLDVCYWYLTAVTSPLLPAFQSQSYIDSVFQQSSSSLRTSNTSTPLHFLTHSLIIINCLHLLSV